MFIVWGKRVRPEDGGVVGDWCPVCSAVHVFRLTHHYSVNHIYYIPLGSGTYAATSRTCISCGAESPCDPRQYARILAHQEALGRTVNDILQTTNPFLADQINGRRAFQQEMARRQESGAMGGGGPVDPRLLSALNALESFDARSEEVLSFTNRLQKWDYLSATEREVLLREVEKFTRQEQEIRRAVDFIKSLPSPEPGWVFAASTGLVVVALVVGFGLVPFLRSWVWGTLYVLAVIGGSMALYGQLSARKTCEWVDAVLIPRARVAGVDLRLMVGILSTVDSGDLTMDERITDMAGNLDTIQDVLNERGLLTLQPASPPAEYATRNP